MWRTVLSASGKPSFFHAQHHEPTSQTSCALPEKILLIGAAKCVRCGDQKLSQERFGEVT